MKYYLFIFSLLFINTPIHSQNSTLEKTTTSSLLDSLSNLNYYDFYGKSIEDLLSNKIINSYTDYYLLPLEHSFNTIETIQLNYTLEKITYRLSISLSKIHKNDNTLDSLMKAKIREVEFGDKKCSLNIDEVSNFNSFNDQPLISFINYCNCYNNIHFIDEKVDNSNQYKLKIIMLTIMIENKKTVIIINLKEEPLIFDLSKTHWNLNELQNLKIKTITFF